MVKKAPIKSLSQGRPPNLKKQGSSLSSKATRTIIRKHHNLLKKQSQAQRSGDAAQAGVIAQEIEQNGGLEKYQQASQIGQLSSRGGDTSKVLKTWLEEDGVPLRDGAGEPLCVLEIGCLSPSNAIAGCKNVRVVRIDLHSSHPSILEQDFMQRPLPAGDEDRFDIVSLSLVLNYVATPAERGDMLLRTTKFLRCTKEHQTDGTDGPGGSTSLPSLFLTLPLPCVNNSRYLTEDHLQSIMETLGYRFRHSKNTSKLFYSLWHYDPAQIALKGFKKTEISPGQARNNFSITFKK